VPPGVVRIEADAAFETWDRRFNDGDRESLGAGLTTSALGTTLVPSLATSELLVRRITGISDYQLNLGRLDADVLADRGIGMFGLSLGLTRAITIFGRMPLVRSRVQPALTLDPDGANAGVTPGFAEQEAFFQQFDDAIATLASRIAAGAYDGDPALRALADATLESGGVLLDDLFLLLADPDVVAPFAPTASSEAGTALVGRVAALQTTLAGSLGIPGFSVSPSLPSEPLTEDDFAAFAQDPLGPIGRRLGEDIVSFRGDAEAGAAVTLADRWDRGARRGGFRAAVEGLVRFPTGNRPRLDRLLALGTGEGQTDIELRGTVDVGSGQLGARLEAGYNRQLAADMADRVASPDEPLAGVDRITNVRRDPGDVVSLAVRPFLRLARTFALSAALEHQSRGEDEVTYATDADALPGIDPAIAVAGTEASATMLAVGFTYANPGALRPGGSGLPVDAGWTYERMLRASGGFVPDVHRVRARLRVYIGVF
jgi:hypothetical protein